jgi:hypothetical protein
MSDHLWGLLRARGVDPDDPASWNPSAGVRLNELRRHDSPRATTRPSRQPSTNCSGPNCGPHRKTGVRRSSPSPVVHPGSCPNRGTSTTPTDSPIPPSGA